MTDYLPVDKVVQNKQKQKLLEKYMTHEEAGVNWVRNVCESEKSSEC